MLNLVVGDMPASLDFYRRLGVVPPDGEGAAGYPGRQQPFDAFWGARYAIVADPLARA